MVDPPIGKEGEKVAVRSEVTNLMEEAGVFTASLWLNSQLHSTKAIAVAGNATVAIAFDVAPRAVSYELRLDRLLTSLVVEAAEAPAAAKAGEEAASAAAEARVEPVEAPASPTAIVVPTLSDEVDAGTLTFTRAMLYVAGLIPASFAIYWAGSLALRRRQQTTT